MRVSNPEFPPTPPLQPHVPRRGQQRILLIVGLALFAVSNGRWIVPIAAWIAPALLLAFLRNSQPLRGIMAVTVGIVAVSFIMLRGIVPSHLGWISAALVIVVALLWAAPYLCDRWIARPGDGFAGTLVFPAAAVAVEYLSNLQFGTWGSWAYTQVENPCLLQLSSVTGLWGITFVVLWTASTIAHLWRERQAGRPCFGTAAVWASVLLTVLLFGGTRLAVRGSECPTVRVGWFTPGSERDEFLTRIDGAGYASSRQMLRSDRQLARELVRPYVDAMLSRTEKLAHAGAGLVVWPESAAPLPFEEQGAVMERASNIARQTGSHILLSYNMYPANWPREPDENKSVLITPDGSVGWEYLKARPVPGASHRAGDGVLPIRATSLGRWSQAICYDLDFPHLIRQAGRAEVELFLAPSWDWREIDPLHTRMAMVRAVENGMPLVRVTGMGLSVAVDPLGRVLASLDHFDGGERTTVAAVPLRRSWALYPWIGDSFAWLCLAYVPVFGVGAVRRRRGSAGACDVALPPPGHRGPVNTVIHAATSGRSTSPSRSESQKAQPGISGSTDGPST